MPQRWTVRTAEDLGRAVGELRRDRGMTQGSLAASSGLDRTWLSKLENGRSAPVLDHLLLLLRRLGATITITVGGPDG